MPAETQPWIVLDYFRLNVKRLRQEAMRPRPNIPDGIIKLAVSESCLVE